MAVWNCHPHPSVRKWIISHARGRCPGLLQSFDVACEYAADDENWGGISGQYAFADYVPFRHPLTYPMILKLRIEGPYVTVVAVALEREALVYKVE